MGIKLDSERMSTLSSSFMRKAGDISELVSSLKTDVQELASCWEGAGCDEFLSDFEQVEKNVNEMISIMENRSSVLSSQASATDEFSTAMANAWK